MFSGSDHQSKTRHFVSQRNCSPPHNYWFILILSFSYSWPVMCQPMASGQCSPTRCLMVRRSQLDMPPPNSAEQNYSQLEKEGLLCVFRVKRFYSYLFGHPFTLTTDHKPVLGLLSKQKPTSLQVSARICCWYLYLSMFEYTL